MTLEGYWLDTRVLLVMFKSLFKVFVKSGFRAEFSMITFFFLLFIEEVIFAVNKCAMFSGLSVFTLEPK